MNVIDLAIVLIIATGVISGLRSGLIRPLIPEAALLALAGLVYTRPDLVDRHLPAGVSRITFVVLLFVAVFVAASLAAGWVAGAVQSLPVIGFTDRLIGAIGHGLLAFLVAYLMLSALIGFDRVVAPVAKGSTITAAQVAALQANLAGNPAASLLLHRSGVDELAAGAAKQGIPRSTLERFDSMLAWYLDVLRPQLAGSRLAPRVLAIGRWIPILGHDLRLPASSP